MLANCFNKFSNVCEGAFAEFVLLAVFAISSMPLTTDEKKLLSAVGTMIPRILLFPLRNAAAILLG